MSMLSVPEGSWSGASGVPAPHLMRGERWQCSRFAEHAPEMFECESADATKNLARRKRASFGNCVRPCGRTDKISSSSTI